MYVNVPVVRDLMDRIRWTNAALAEQADIDARTVRRAFNGESNSFKTLKAMHDAICQGCICAGIAPPEWQEFVHPATSDQGEPIRFEKGGTALTHVLTLEGHEKSVTAACWLGATDLIATASYDGTVRVWDTVTGQCVERFDGPENERLFTLVFHDGRLMSAGRTGQIRIWHAENWVLERIIDTEAKVRALRAGRSETILSTGDDSKVREFNINTGECVNILSGHEQLTRCAIWHNGLVLSVSHDRSLRGWDLGSNSEVFSMRQHSDDINALCAIDSSTVVTASDDETIVVWSLETKQMKKVLRAQTGKIIELSLSADGTYMASKSDNGSVFIWNTDSWQHALVVPENLTTFWPVALAFHPSKPVLATLTNDSKSIRIWEMSGIAPSVPLLAEEKS